MTLPVRNTITAGELATLVGAELIGPGSLVLTHADSLEQGGAGAVSFIRSAKFARAWRDGGASAAVVSKSVPRTLLGEAGPDRALLIVPDADTAMLRVLAHFAPRPAEHAAGVHHGAFVDSSASIDATASIGPGCTVGAGARVGAYSVLVAQVHIGAHALVGSHCLLHPFASVLDRCEIGERCILHSGVVIGADGFGYRPSAGGPVKVPQIGNVVLGREVEIGANTCIDRAKFGSTTIGDQTKIDNLVQVGHGCRIGKGCIICGKVGLSGSVTIGDGAVLGGSVGVSDNSVIGAGAQLAAFSGVHGTVPPGALWMGAPAGPIEEWRRTYASLRKMGKRPGTPANPAAAEES